MIIAFIRKSSSLNIDQCSHFVGERDDIDCDAIVKQVEQKRGKISEDATPLCQYFLLTDF